MSKKEEYSGEEKRVYHRSKGGAVEYQIVGKNINEKAAFLKDVSGGGISLYVTEPVTLKVYCSRT